MSAIADGLALASRAWPPTTRSCGCPAMPDDLDRVEDELLGRRSRPTTPASPRSPATSIRAGGKRLRPALRRGRRGSPATTPAADGEVAARGRARRRVRRAGPPRLALPRRRHRRGRHPPHASRASTPAGATSRPSSPATSCWPRPRRSPPALGTEVAGLLAATIGRLCEGEVARAPGTPTNVDRTEDDYLASIEGKTAALFATACRIGAIVGGLARDRRRPRSPRSAPRTAWRSRSSTTCSTWSPPTSSSASRPATTWSRASTPCPVLRALETGEGAELRVAARPAARTATEWERARSLVRQSGGVESAIAEARAFAARAAEELQPVGHHAGRRGAGRRGVPPPVEHRSRPGRLTPRA